MPLVLLVFYGDFLRIPLEFCYPPADFQTWKFLRFFAYDFPKAAEALAFSASFRFPHLLSNSAEFGNPGHTRNAVGRLQTGARVQISSSPSTASCRSQFANCTLVWFANFYARACSCTYFANAPHEKPHSVLLGTFFLLAILVVFKATIAPSPVPRKSKLEENRDWK